MTVDAGKLVISQLEFYWDMHLRPRLDGLTDAEYLWEPVEGCWSVRPGPGGGFVADGAGRREPDPPPITTIAWRMMHVAVGCFYTRVSTFFPELSPNDRPRDGADMFDPRQEPPTLPGTAAEGLAFLEDSYRRWHTAITKLSRDELATPLGPRGAYFGEDTMLALIVHVNRETMHHGGEIGLMRDLYRVLRPC